MLSYMDTFGRKIMKKLILLCALFGMFYAYDANSKICFLANPDCKIGESLTTNTNHNNTTPPDQKCPSEYNLLESQKCHAKKYKECIDPQNNSFFKDLGCDIDNGYYNINDPQYLAYIQAKYPGHIFDENNIECDICSNQTRCSDNFKHCTSPLVGRGEVCEEINKDYFVDNNPYKFINCICDEETYPYTEENCHYELSGRCEGDNGIRWKYCTNNNCEYSTKEACESTLEHSVCTQDSEGCWNVTGCQDGYGYGRQTQKLPAKCVNCNIYNYEDTSDNFITYIGVCPTVWFKADVTTPYPESSVLLTISENQKVYGENHTLELDRHSFKLQPNSYIDSLHIIGKNAVYLISGSLKNGTGHPQMHDIDVEVKSLYPQSIPQGDIYTGSLLLTGKHKITMIGDDVGVDHGYYDMVDAKNLILDKDATLDILVKDFVNTDLSINGMYFPGNTQEKSTINGTVNITIENMYHHHSGGQHAISYGGGDVVFNGDVNIKMSGIKNPSNISPKTSAGISVNDPNDVLIFNGKLNMDLEGTNFAIFSDYNSNLILNGDTDVVIKNLQQGMINGRNVNKDKGIISGGTIAFSKNFSISQDDTHNFIANNAILNFASDTSKLVLKSSYIYNSIYSHNPYSGEFYSPDKFGLNVKTKAVKGAKFVIDTNYYATEKECHTSYDVNDEYLPNLPKEYWESNNEGTCAIGNLFYEDGTCGDVKEDDGSKVPVGIVFALSDEKGGLPYKDVKIENNKANHGKVITFNHIRFPRNYDYTSYADTPLDENSVYYMFYPETPFYVSYSSCTNYVAFGLVDSHIDDLKTYATADEVKQAIENWEPDIFNGKENTKKIASAVSTNSKCYDDTYKFNSSKPNSAEARTYYRACKPILAEAALAFYPLNVDPNNSIVGKGNWHLPSIGELFLLKPKLSDPEINVIGDMPAQGKLSVMSSLASYVYRNTDILDRYNWDSFDDLNDELWNAVSVNRYLWSSTLVDDDHVWTMHGGGFAAGNRDNNKSDYTIARFILDF